MSLCRLLQQEDLLKEPSRWTCRHVELFSSFGDPFPAPALQHIQVGKGSGTGCVSSLLSRSNVRWRTTLMRKLLDHPSHTFEGAARFYFGGRCVETFECLVVCHDTGPTITAYFDGGSVNPLHCRPMNQSLQLPHPRILALLVAMAYRQSEKDGIHRRSSYPSRVLFSDPDDKSHMHLFSCAVSQFLIDALKNPTRKAPTDKLFIRHVLIPYEPKKTFRQRIHHLLIDANEQHLVAEHAKTHPKSDRKTSDDPIVTRAPLKTT